MVASGINYSYIVTTDYFRKIGRFHRAPKGGQGDIIALASYLL